MSAAERPTTKMRKAAAKTLDVSKAKVTLSKPTLDVYNDGKRFAIVSRDDRFPALLAYGLGNFDIDKAPANVKWWFEAVQRSMDKAVKENVTRRATAVYTPVTPFVVTKWGQTTPYNNYCPVFEKDKTKAPTGCMATAMAQIINYQEYPASAKFEGSYTVDDIEKTAMVESTYNYPYNIAYGNYLPTADGEVEQMSYTPLQGNKIAALMRDCGYSIGMNYNANASGGLSVFSGAAFIEKFGYPKASVKYLQRYFYADEDWMDMVYSELQNKTPIVYAGSSKDSGGHAFVLHGMDAEGLVFVNWGWSGAYDGYYDINVLTPGVDDFSGAQEMVIGARPTALSTDVWHSIFATEEPYTLSFDNNNKKLILKLVEGIYNQACLVFKGKWVLLLENIDNPEKTEYLDLIDEGEFIDIFHGYGSGTITWELTIEPGTYHIYVATADVGEANWQYVRTFGGCFYYDMTVEDNGTVTISTTPTFTTATAPEAPEIPEPTGIQNILAKPIVSVEPVRYFDLQGREVNGSTKGLLIRRQGDEVKKVIVR